MTARPRSRPYDAPGSGFRRMIGEHPAVAALRASILRAAPLDAPVLVEGPTGSGKELVAELLHRHSGRQGKLVAVNLAAVPEQLADAELFGAERGAFTGAAAARAGLLEDAGGGTLYLDEACDLAPALQGKLLRVLESGSLRRLGGTADRKVAFRLVVSVQRPAYELLESGRWRSDFYYRVAGLALRVPPLSERLGDIQLLAEAFLQELGRGRADAGSIGLLQRHTWPGNVRELRRVIERAVFLAEDDEPGVEQFRQALHTITAAAPAGGRQSGERTLREIERQHIVGVLRETGSDVDVAAGILGISRWTLYRRIRALGLGSRALQ